MGLTEAGFDVVLGIDHDDDSLETHRAYHPGLSVNWDLGDPDVVEEVAALVTRLDVQLIAGGPPCQPFSSAARSALRDLVRKGVRPQHDRRRDLWQSFLRIVSVARPEAVLMENVPEMALDRDMWILRTMVDELEEMGYAVEERLVTTADYGVPQMRHRLILVGLRDGSEFRWPQPGPMVNLRNAIGDLPAVDGGWRPTNGEDPADPVASGWTEYLAGPFTEFQQRMRRDLPAEWHDRLYDHITRPVREDDALAFAQMDSTTRYSQLSAELRRYRDDIFDDKYKRLDWNQLSRTITAHISKDGYWYIHPSQDRTLTVREAARIQTFGDHVRFAGPPSSAFRQIGNAVPPLLAEHLGKAILTSLAAHRPAARLSRRTSMLLSTWFAVQERLSIPWLKAITRWQVIMGELLWGRAIRENVWEAWRAIENLTTPDDLLDPAKAGVLQKYVNLRGRGDRFEPLIEAAEWLRGSSGLGGRDNVTSLMEAPGVTQAIADLAVRVCPGCDEERDEPVLTTYGVLRVAGRFFGADVERRNRQSDGRLAVARMIGGDEASHGAHLALIELANSVCVAGRIPDCAFCPLVSECAFPGSNGYQVTLPLTSQGC
jgi:DNA (cytosine-5)-methyltransferase 1